VAEKLVTIAKHGRADATKDVASRCQALSVLRNRSNIDRLFGTLAERYATRNGGYTRILKYGRRAGDNAPLSIIEFVDRPAAPAQTEG
jgi:large subunit ribosomal protein L17